MKQKYWFNRSLSRSRENKQQPDNSIDNRSKNQKVIFYNETNRKQLSEINEQARKINAYLGNLKHQNRLYHEVNIEEYQMKNQVRCLKHNSVIILYCFTDNKLLCSNCVYGTTQHTKHKVNQAKTMDSKIEQVLVSNEKAIRVRGYEINSSMNFFQDIQKKISTLKNESLEKLDQELQQHSILLSTYYQKSKKKLLQTFETAKQEVRCFVEQMRQLSKNMKFQHSLIVVRQLHVQQVMDYLNKITRLIPSHRLGQNLVQTLSNFGKAVVNSFKNGFSNLNK